MKSLVFLLGVSVCGAFGQAVMEDPVVVVMDGKEWRKSEMERFVKSLPPPQQRNFYSNRKGFLEQFALTLQLAKAAREKGLGEKDPYKYRQLYNESLFYAQAIIQEISTSFPVLQEEKEKYFAQHKGDYARAKVKLIFIGFSPEGVPVPAGMKSRNLAEAQKLANDAASRAKSGEDFVALVKAFSDDTESKAKDGDYPDLKPTDEAVPPAVKTAVFSLQPGGVTDPLAQPNGFYIFKLVGLAEPALQEVNDEVVLEIQRSRFDEWMKSIQKGVKLEFKDQQFLSEPAPKQ
jgi:parvulin-like peptidyl-prolyl isomerase